MMGPQFHFKFELIFSHSHCRRVFTDLSKLQLQRGAPHLLRVPRLSRPLQAVPGQQTALQGPLPATTAGAVLIGGVQREMQALRGGDVTSTVVALRNLPESSHKVACIFFLHQAGV